MEAKNSATIKQLGYLIYLLEEQGIVRNGLDFVKFEKLVKVRIFEMDKTQASEYIDKLKSDVKWLEMITNQVLGTN